ncbi:hypothetical protein RAZWK3B_09036 [Roseobacter sp. AzwK-3b]|uniref:hypothetical protein n=1 Tax=Roseobacter sp. AzwK-3b TaxID=351016 RepID=UPI0001569809|nr:hypothetical protein [Roseobacter sp. AzwK-3b]EDM72383.1 hypothetical protein RAZWK3B_09036 [Roseobacter sp. AzwK-3b]
MTQVRTYLAIALAFVLTLTAQSTALARSAPDPAGQMVLCTGTGPVTVLVDAQGQPTGAVHICPECALSLFQVTSSDTPDLLRPTTWTPAQTIDLHLEIFDLARLPARARGPPVHS